MDIRRVSSTYNPATLFQGVCQRNSRFKGFQQHDAHDLLINLLDMMVLESDKLTKRTKDEKMRGAKKSIVEEVFGGYYLNTGKLFLLMYFLLVLCLDCMRVSRTRDLTLDISVTISFKNQGIYTLQEEQLRKMIEDKSTISGLQYQT